MHHELSSLFANAGVIVAEDLHFGAHVLWQGAEGQLSRRDLLHSSATLVFRTQAAEGIEGSIFRVNTPEFCFECQIVDGHLELSRNRSVVRAKLPPAEGGLVTFAATLLWTPTVLHAHVLDVTGRKVVARVDTPHVVPPFSLLEWARDQELIRRSTYPNRAAVYREVVDQLQALADKIKRSAAVNPFWDIEYSGQTIVSRTPKRETDIHPTVSLLLYDLDMSKGLQVTPEYQAGPGRLDFLISGFSEHDRRQVHVCVEFKLAHSADLAAGILRQLPAYMRQRQTDYGVYCVVDFGASYRFELSGFRAIPNFTWTSETALDMALSVAKDTTGLKHLRVIMFDVTKPVSPSKL